MQINVSFDHLKKAGIVLFVVASLFSVYTSASYTLWRRRADPVFQVMEFDLNSRRPEIQKRYLAQKAAAEAAAAAAAAKAAEPTPDPATTPTTLPPKKP
jgi:hypothetical protein